VAQFYKAVADSVLEQRHIDLCRSNNMYTEIRAIYDFNTSTSHVICSLVCGNIDFRLARLN